MGRIILLVRSLLAIVLLILCIAWVMSVAWTNDAFELYGRWALTAIVAAPILGALVFSFVRGYRRT